MMERPWHKHYDPLVPRKAKYPEECLPLLIEKTVKQLPTRPATEFFGVTLTYEALWRQILSLAHALRERGVNRGDRVAIMLPNSPQAVIAYYAVLWLGAVVVLTNPLYVEREMEHQWVDAGATVLVTLDHLYPRVEKVLPKTSIRLLIVTSLREYFPLILKVLYPIEARRKKLFTAVPYGSGTLNFSELVRNTPPTPPSCPAGPDDLALLQYTGGTTGVAKGVMLIHRSIVANVVQISSWFPDLHCGRERFLSILPFFHVFGMTVSMNFPLYTGCTAIIVPRFEAGELLKTIHRSKPTLFPGVPTLFTGLVGHPKLRSHNLSSIRFCVTGSAPMPVEVLRRFEELTGGIIIEGYGLTEASPVTHVNPIKGLRKAGSVGIALPDTDCRVVDLETGERDAPVGQEGELVVRGPQMMRGYWQMPEETKTALRDGWLFTGDIAVMDEDGYVFVVDRKKDMIIAGGYNIYPREIDEVLYEHPGILDAVAVGVPDPYRGETVKAFVVPRPGESLTEAEVIRFCRERLAAYKVPRSVVFRESLPKTIIGKVLRKELRREILQKTD